MRTAPYLRDLAWVEEDAKLPEGKTCGDCVFFQHCQHLIGQIAKDEICDFTPNKFRLAIQVEAAAHVTA